MSPALNGSSVIQRFEHSNAIEIRNRILLTFDFYMGLPHMWQSWIKNRILFRHIFRAHHQQGFIQDFQLGGGGGKQDG